MLNRSTPHCLALERLEERVVLASPNGFFNGNVAWWVNETDQVIPASGTSGSSNATFINTAGWEGNINYMEIRLGELSHTFPDDMDVLFGSDTLGHVLLMSDAGGGNDINLALTFVPNAYSTNTLPDSGQIVSGVYRRTNYGSPSEGFNSDLFGPILNSDGYYNEPAAQNWRLLINDDASGDTGRLGRWLLVLSTHPYNVSAGGAYTLYEESSVGLAGTALDRETNWPSLRYYWDLDNNGSFGDIPEARTPTVSWSTLKSLGAGGIGNHPIRVQAHDGFSGTNSSTSIITVVDEVTIAPTIKLSRSPIVSNTVSLLSGGSVAEFGDVAQRFYLSASDNSSVNAIRRAANTAPVRFKTWI